MPNITIVSSMITSFNGSEGNEARVLAFLEKCFDAPDQRPVVEVENS